MIKAEAKKAGADVWFADEAGIRTDYLPAPPGPRSGGPQW
jgi:hypothetical protein